MQKLLENFYRFRVPLLLFWFSFVFILALFYPLGGDEVGYFYQAKLFAKGEIPVLDFFAIQPLGFFIPYATIARWFSPSLEAMRLVSVFSCITVPVLIALLVFRFYGRTLAIYAFFIIAFSHWFFYWNVQIIHYSIANLSLFTSIFILFFFRPRWIFFFLAGFAMGWAINARLSLGPAGVVLFVLSMSHVGKTEGIPWKERFIKQGLPFALGGVFASLPMIALLIADSEAFLFNLLTARMNLRDDARILAGGDPGVMDFLKRRFGVIYSFFLGTNYTYPKAMTQNVILLIALLFFVSAGLRRSQDARKVWRKAIFQDTFLTTGLWLILVIFLAHFFTVMPAGTYLQFIFPLMTMVILGIFFHGGIHTITRSLRDRDGWVLRALALCLVPYVFYHLAFCNINLIRRNVPNIVRPVTAAHVGCWIENNTPVNEVIMGVTGLPVSVAGRRFPTGFEFAAGNIPLFWRYSPIDKQTASRFQIFRFEDFQENISLGNYRILLVEYDTLYWIKRLDLQEALKKNYRLFATTGGGEAFANRRYDIYLRNDQKDEDYTQMPPMGGPYALEQLVQFLKGKISPGSYKKWDLIRNTTKETLGSIALLPSDIGLAWNRLIQASHEKRCYQYSKIKP